MTTAPTPYRVVRRSRTGPLVACALATLGGLLIAATTKIGPVVLSITSNHGVHAGDLVGFGVCYAAALLATVRRPARTSAPPVRPRWPDAAPVHADAPTIDMRVDDAPTRPLHLAPRR